MKNMKKRFFAILMVLAMAITMIAPAVQANPKKDNVNPGNSGSKLELLSAQAVTDYGFYGQKLSEVILTYNKKVDAKSVNKDSFTVLDYPQNYTDGEKLPAPIADVEVKDEQIIIHIADVPELNEKGTSNPVGVLVAVNWYLNAKGEVVKGGKGYYHLDDVHTEVLVNDYVKANNNKVLANPGDVITMTEATQHNKFDQFERFDGILPDANGQFDSIKAYIHMPEGAKEGTAKYPMVILGPGGQTTYHEEVVPTGLEDGSTMKIDNAATALTMDYSCVGWLDAPEDVIICALSTSNSKNIVAIAEHFIAEMNADPNRIYLIGNSAGCTQSAAAIQARPDLFAAYNNNNGGFTFPSWNDAQKAALVMNKISVLFAAGETDSEKPRNNQNQYLELVDRYRAAGYDEEWIDENVRIYGYPHAKFAPWGVTDHSATKVTYYYYRDRVYNDPDTYFGHEGAALEAGSLYTMPDIKPGNNGDVTNYSGIPYGEYEYRVYGDMSVMEWMLGRSKNPVEGLGEPQVIGAETVALDNSKSGIRLPYSGYFTGTANDRAFKLYIPEDMEIKTYQVVLNAPEGVDVGDYLVSSGWKTLADQKGFMLRVVEPGEAGWGAEDDLAYVTKVMGTNSSITNTTYVVGYGKGGSVLQQYTMANACNISAGAFANASNVDASYMAQMAETFHTYKAGAPSDVAYSDVPLPVWFMEDSITEAEQAVIDYWAKAGDIVGEGEAFFDGMICSQDPELVNALTPVGNINKIAVTGAKNITPADIYAFLDDFIRYGGTSIGSNSLMRRPDYEALGVQTYSIQYNDIRRDYLVYVPESVKKSGAKAPVVFTMHGNGSGYRMIFDTSDWWEVADKYGFIVVAPNGAVTATSVKTGAVMGVTFTKNNEAKPFEMIVKDMIARNIPVDTGRMYLHGQSQGHEGIVAIVEEMPELFTAVGGTTRIAYPMVAGSEYDLSKFPGTYYMAGQYDNTAHSLGEGTAEKPSDLAKFLRLLGVDWEVGSNGGNVKEADKVIVNGIYTTYEWDDADGNYIFSTTKAGNRGHSMKASDVWRMWEDGFSKWNRDAAGVLYYEGKVAR